MMSDDFQKRAAAFNKDLREITQVKEVALKTILESIDESEYEVRIVDGEEEFVHFFGNHVAYIDTWHRLLSRSGITKSGRFIYEMQHVNNFRGYGDFHYLNLTPLNVDDFEEGVYAGHDVWRNFVYVGRLHTTLTSDTFLKERGFRPFHQWKTIMVDGKPVVKASRNRFREVVDKAWWEIRTHDYSLK